MGEAKTHTHALVEAKKQTPREPELKNKQRWTKGHSKHPIIKERTFSYNILTSRYRLNNEVGQVMQLKKKMLPPAL